MTDSPTPQLTASGERIVTPDHEPFRILAFSGSLRAASSNTGLVRLARRLADQQAPGDTAWQFLDWIDQLPYYDEDLEASVPDLVAKLRNQIAAADALVIGMPEYNFGPSAVAKNVIDWASRPAGSPSLRGKVISMLTSAGKGGGANVQGGLVPVLTWLGSTVITDAPVNIAMGMTRIDASGATEDQDVLDAVGANVASLLAALRAR